MNVQKRAKQFLLDQNIYKNITFLNKVKSNTTQSTYFYFMGELEKPFESKTFKGKEFKEYYEVVMVRVSDHENREHCNSEWYSKNKVISGDVIDFADDLKDAKEIALGI